MAYRSPFYQPRQDTGWGLIYRLNLLLGKIENDVESGDLDSWDKHINAIHRNVSDQRKPIIERDEKDGSIIKITFDKEDVDAFIWFANKIKEIRDEIAKALRYEDESEKNKKLKELHDKYYNILVQKDMWIRKYMGDLYRKVIEHDPSKAIYGG